MHTKTHNVPHGIEIENAHEYCIDAEHAEFIVFSLSLTPSLFFSLRVRFFLCTINKDSSKR